MELWDIYDENKQRTGRTMKKNDWCLKDGEYHLTVLGVVARKDGKFLITKRVMTKSWAPGWWEVSGGGVLAGEDSHTAVLREVREESGLTNVRPVSEDIYSLEILTVGEHQKNGKCVRTRLNEHPTPVENIEW